MGPAAVCAGGWRPAREIATREPAARSGRSRGPPWPCRHPPALRPGPAGHTAASNRAGLRLLVVSLVVWSRRVVSMPGRPPSPSTGTTVGPRHPISAIFHSTEASPVSKTAYNQPTEVSLVADPACSVPNKQDRRVGTEHSCNRWHHCRAGTEHSCNRWHHCRVGTEHSCNHRHHCRPTTPHLSHFSLNRGVTGFKDRTQPTGRGVIGCRSRL